jgi:hypothetical protein
MAHIENRAIRRSKAYQDFVRNIPEDQKAVPPEVRATVFACCKRNMPQPILEYYKELCIANYSAQDVVEKNRKTIQELAGSLAWVIIHSGNDYY